MAFAVDLDQQAQECTSSAAAEFRYFFRNDHIDLALTGRIRAGGIAGMMVIATMHFWGIR